MRGTRLEANKPRFASLEVLYAWTHGKDPQELLHEVDSDCLVWSADDRHFFPWVANRWTVADLIGDGPPARSSFFDPGKIQPEHRAEVIERLASVDADVVASAVALPPDTWDITLDERVTLAEYLLGRVDDTVRLFTA